MSKKWRNFQRDASGQEANGANGEKSKSKVSKTAVVAGIYTLLFVIAVIAPTVITNLTTDALATSEYADDSEEEIIEEEAEEAAEESEEDSSTRIRLQNADEQSEDDESVEDTADLSEAESEVGSENVESEIIETDDSSVDAALEVADEDETSETEEDASEAEETIGAEEVPDSATEVVEAEEDEEESDVTAEITAVEEEEDEDVAELAKTTLTEDGIAISESLPYEGMDAKFIDVTWLGEHDESEEDEDGTISYYWLADNDTGVTVFTAYVLDGVVVRTYRNNSRSNYWYTAEDGYFDYPDMDATGEEIRYVYITATGSKYHRYTSCRGLNNANATYKVTLSEAISLGFEPCSICY